MTARRSVRGPELSPGMLKPRSPGWNGAPTSRPAAFMSGICRSFILGEFAVCRNSPTVRTSNSTSAFDVLPRQYATLIRRVVHQ